MTPDEIASADPERELTKSLYILGGREKASFLVL
jgi:hypothetical protein